MPKAIIRTDTGIERRLGIKRSMAGAADALQTAVTLLAQARVGAPYLAYFIFQILLMTVYLAANTGVAASFWALLVGGDGESFGRYPAHLLLMQPVLNRVEMLLDVFVRILFHAATIVLVRAALLGKPVSPAGGFAAAARRYPALLLVALVSSAAVFAAVNAGRMLSMSLPVSARHIASAGGIAAALAVQALLVYAAPYVMIGGRSFAGAVAGGLVMARRLPATTILIVALPFVLVVPTTLIGLRAEVIALQLAPEFMIHLHVASKVMETISLYLVTAGATVIFMKRSGRPAAEDPGARGEVPGAGGDGAAGRSRK